jgi:hypothetical protein
MMAAAFALRLVRALHEQRQLTTVGARALRDHRLGGVNVPLGQRRLIPLRAGREEAISGIALIAPCDVVDGIAVERERDGLPELDARAGESPMFITRLRLPKTG